MEKVEETKETTKEKVDLEMVWSQFMHNVSMATSKRQVLLLLEELKESFDAKEKISD